MILYIFTPTYNRATYLSQLYLSLCRQTNQQFIWLIIDDGSTDDTSQLIQGFIAEGRLDIQYIYQENGGKHTAYNTALDIMNGQGYHVCVDSDDYLFDTAVEEFHLAIVKLEREFLLIDYVGAVFPRTHGTRQVGWLPYGLDKIHIPDVLFVYRLSIETTILINNCYLKSFRFSTFSEEQFLSEETMYYYLSDVGHFYPINKEVCYTEYLDDGLTNHLFTLWQKNYKGTLYSLGERHNYISKHLSGVHKWRNIVKCQMNSQALKLTRHSFWALLKNEPYKCLLPFSYVWKWIRFKKVRMVEHDS